MPKNQWTKRPHKINRTTHRTVGPFYLEVEELSDYPCDLHLSAKNGNGHRFVWSIHFKQPGVRGAQHEEFLDGWAESRETGQAQADQALLEIAGIIYEDAEASS
jgi:hypothetical protein